MQIGSFHIMAPALGAPAHSEAEAFGAVTGLWMHTPGYQDVPLNILAGKVLPPIKTEQFILASTQEGGAMKPVAFMAWANFSAEAESRYLENAAAIRPQDWASGDRMWAINWFAPFGHCAEFRRLVGQVLPNSCFRSLYHRGNERGLRVMNFRGDKVAAPQSQAWWAARPMMAAMQRESIDSHINPN